MLKWRRSKGQVVNMFIEHVSPGDSRGQSTFSCFPAVTGIGVLIGAGARVECLKAVEVVVGGLRVDDSMMSRSCPLLSAFNSE